MAKRTRLGLYPLVTVAGLGFMSMAGLGCTDPAPAVVYDCYSDAECNRDGKINGTCSPATHQCTYPAVTIQFDVDFADGHTMFLSRNLDGSIVLPQGMRGLAYEVHLGANGGDGIYLWAPTSGSAAVELVPGVRLSSTGILSGTPTASGPASCLSLRVGSAGLWAEDTFCLTIGERTPNTLTPAAPLGAAGEVVLPYGLINAPYLDLASSAEVMLRFGGGGRPPFRFEYVSGSLPSGVSVESSNDANGSYVRLGGTPEASGTWTVTVRFNDGFYRTNGVSDPEAANLIERTFSLTVRDAP